MPPQERRTPSNPPVRTNYAASIAAYVVEIVHVDDLARVGPP
jgi:hypothetical protein